MSLYHINVQHSYYDFLWLYNGKAFAIRIGKIIHTASKNQVKTVKFGNKCSANRLSILVLLFARFRAISTLISRFFSRKLEHCSKFNSFYF